MNYNYSQPQYQNPQGAAYTPYRTAPQYPMWSQAANPSSQVRPVSSIEEVRACPIDFDGSVFYFADVANRRIYTKQINLDGTVSINLYEQKELTTTDQPAISSTDYVTKEEFEKVVESIKIAYERLANSMTPQTEKILEPIKEDIQQTAAQPTALFSF